MPYNDYYLKVQKVKRQLNESVNVYLTSFEKKQISPNQMSMKWAKK